jgi:SAM-dependent methyltransferase
MHYDPIKRSLGKVFNQSPTSRILFYKLLDILLLRTWHIHRELRAWRKSAPQQPSVLDAGSGFGQYSYFMSKLMPGIKILGVDVKTEQIKECNEFFSAIGKKDIRFEEGDLTKFKKENTYDLVLCVDVMEHIEEDVLVLSNYCASLKPGGMLLISTPSDQGGSDVHDDGETSFIEEHVRDGYNLEDIKQKALKAGFSKVEARYSYGTPGKISWRLSMKYPMSLLNISQIFFIILPFYYLITMPFALLLNFMDCRMNHASGTGVIFKAWK